MNKMEKNGPESISSILVPIADPSKMFTILAKRERETPSIRLYPSIHPSSNQTPFSHPLVMTLLSSPLVHFRLPFFNHPMTLKKPVDVGDKGKGDGEVAHQTVKKF
jgi:hypothetical protein